MAVTIQLKYSDVAGKVPTPAQLDVGEVVVNLPDRKLYTKDTFNNVIPLGGGVAVSAVAPTSPAVGALWVDTSNPANPVLKMYQQGGTWGTTTGLPKATKAGQAIISQTVVGNPWAVEDGIIEGNF